MDRNQEKEALAMFGNVLKETDSSFLMLRGILYTRIGHINYKNKDYRTALKYDLMALHVRHLDRSPVAVNSSLINVAGDYLKLGNLDSGTIYMDSGMIMAVRYDRKTYVENGYRHLYNYYLEQGMYKIALDYWVRYRTIKDELDREKERNYIAILETNQHLQQVEQSRRENATQHDIQALNLKQQGYQTAILKILTTMAAFAMLVIVLWFLNIRRLRHRMQEINVHLSEEIRERESAEQQTRERDSQYRFITDNSVDFITHTDHEHRRIYASPASRWIYGYEPGEILSKSPHDLTNPEFHEYTDARLKEMKERRTTQQFVYLARKKDGSSFWVESILNPLFDPASGNFKGMVGVTRDIQERKTKELEIMEGTKQKENLLKEIHHRVKNNFAILVSLINMQMAQTKNEELLQSLTNLQLRIRTMALVHEMLYRSGDFEKISFPGYLRSLASVIAGTYNRRNVELTIDAEEVVMDIEALIPLGLIINELLSNAYKHAFRDGRAGKIHIRYCVDPETGINTLAVKDNGTGLPSGIHPDQFKSMGLQVVQILCTQIEGTLVTVNDPGASFTITFRPSVK
jgi:PAS domain S-box-containing protein